MGQKTRDIVPDHIRAELVATLFATRGPVVIISALFVAITAVAAWESGDALLAILSATGSLISAARIAMMLHDRRIFRAGTPAPRRVRAIERRFTLASFTYSLVLGAFGARTVALGLAEPTLLVMTLILGHGAGVTSSVAMRPRIAIGAISAASLPAVAVLLLRGALSPTVEAVAILAFMAGGFRSILTRYRAEVVDITTRRDFADLARSDHLTALPNRLALAEYLTRLDREQPGVPLVLLALDLDGFKPVNDQFGHASGDAILIEVAQRLRDLAGASGFAARMGGDEFVLIETGRTDPGAPELIARRIERELARPYRLGETTLRIGSSIGHTTRAAGDTLDQLVARADEAMRRAKLDRPPPSRPLPPLLRAAC